MTDYSALVERVDEHMTPVTGTWSRTDVLLAECKDAITALSAERDALRAEVERLKVLDAETLRSCQHWIVQYNDAEADLRSAAAREAELRADADRYRWLREHGDDYVEGDQSHGYLAAYYDGLHLQQGAELDALIDAAHAALAQSSPTVKP